MPTLPSRSLTTNGADKAALKLALLGRPVKKMIGGVTGWLDEGFTLAEGGER